MFRFFGWGGGVDAKKSIYLFVQLKYKPFLVCFITFDRYIIFTKALTECLSVYKIVIIYVMTTRLASSDCIDLWLKQVKEFNRILMCYMTRFNMLLNLINLTWNLLV